MRNALTCVLICQPSASNAIEWERRPAVISTTIITPVITITIRVRRSPLEKSGTKSWVFPKREWSVRCIRQNYRDQEKLSSKIGSDRAVEPAPLAKLRRTDTDAAAVAVTKRVHRALLLRIGCRASAHPMSRQTDK